MNPYKFESDLCELLHALGFWALNIPKNRVGAQPFDVIAMKDRHVFASDCKVCGSHLFRLDRVEDNQWLAFSAITERADVNAGITAYYNGDIYWIGYCELVDLRNRGKSSVDLWSRHPMWTKEDVKRILGRYIE